LLIITADDYGLWPSYDEGILEAAAAGAVDAVGAMVARPGCDPAPLLETGVEVGLHLELEIAAGRLATPEEREAAVSAMLDQIASFGDLFGRLPAYLDGHHHCHAAAGLAAAAGREARERELAVRSVGARHRRLLQCQGVPTPDRLIGRVDESEPALPAEVEAVLAGGGLPAGVTEWMVHPGHPDPASGSSYDRGRGEDLAIVMRLRDERALRVVRATHAEALGSGVRRG
jgi:predicted glycoside hydrolase/deacetylase ChbG (UPF0249 family)